jgi:hypothetical protein
MVRPYRTDGELYAFGVWTLLASAARSITVRKSWPLDIMELFAGGSVVQRCVQRRAITLGKLGSPLAAHAFPPVLPPQGAELLYTSGLSRQLAASVLAASCPAQSESAHLECC